MGKAIFVGGNLEMTVPMTGIMASDIAVGSTVKVMENGSAIEYLVVNKGVPSNSSLYDSSCDGVWLLRKGLYEQRILDSSYESLYSTCSLNKYLNGTFLSLLDKNAQRAIKEVKVPYYNGLNVSSSTSGLSTKIFLLSMKEVGGVVNDAYAEGAKLAYFEAGDVSSAKTLRIALFNGTAKHWWIRTFFENGTPSIVTSDGRTAYGDFGPEFEEAYVRPAFVVPHNAVFDEKTMILKGVV